MSLLLLMALATMPPACSDAEYRVGWQDGYEWRKPLPPALHIHWEPVPPGIINAICRPLRPGLMDNYTVQAHGCAERKGDTCVMWMPGARSQVPLWIICHELRHCAGWVHE